jgi:hypothetical protein
VAAPARPCTPSTLAARRLRFQGHHGVEGVSRRIAYNIEYSNDLPAALSVLVHSRTRRREQGFMRNFRGIRDEAAE